MVAAESWVRRTAQEGRQECLLVLFVHSHGVRPIAVLVSRTFENKVYQSSVRSVPRHSTHCISSRRRLVHSLHVSLNCVRIFPKSL